MKIKLTRPAVRDLAEIGRCTRRTWGEQQARRYRIALTERFKWLGDNKALWRKRPELGENVDVYTHTEQSHVIVFRAYTKGIEILRIIHARMDLRQPFQPPGETE